MYELLTPLFSGTVTIFGLLLLAFTYRQKCAVCVQLTFLYFAGYYLLFLVTHLVNIEPINALAMASGFLEGPLILWLVLTFSVGQRKPIHIWHWLPAAVSLAIYLAAPVAGQDILYIFVSISRMAYAAACCVLLWGGRHDAKGTDWFSWVPMLVAYMFVLASIKLSAFTIYQLDSSWHAPDWVIFAKTTGAALVVLLLVWWALIKPEIFADVRDESKRHGKAPSDFDSETYKRFSDMLKKEELFKNDDLNLANVADRLAVSSRELSEAVNRVAGMGFRALLRQHRINWACELLATQEGKDIGILEVAMRSGFATKSVFNAAFRSETGLTPTAFKQSNSQ